MTAYTEGTILYSSLKDELSKNLIAYGTQVDTENSTSTVAHRLILTAHEINEAHPRISTVSENDPEALITQKLAKRVELELRSRAEMMRTYAAASCASAEKAVKEAFAAATTDGTEAVQHALLLASAGRLRLAPAGTSTRDSAVQADSGPDTRAESDGTCGEGTDSQRVPYQ